MEAFRKELAALGIVVEEFTRSMAFAPLREMKLKKEIAKEKGREEETWSLKMASARWGGKWGDVEKLSMKTAEEVENILPSTVLKLGEMKELGPELSGTMWEILNAILMPMKSGVKFFKNTATMMIEPIKNPMKVMKKGKKVVGDFLGGLMSAVGPMSLVAVGVQMVSQMAMQLIDALNPFQPLFDAVVAIFTVFGDVMRAQMMPVVGELFEIMLSEDMIEAFTALGAAFAELAVALMPIVKVFAALLIPVLEAVTPLIRLFVIPLRIFAFVIEAMSPLLQAAIIPLRLIGGAAQMAAPLIAALSGALDFLGGIIRSVAGVIRWLADWAVYGFNVVAYQFKRFLERIDVFNVFRINVGKAPERPGALSEYMEIPWMQSGGMVTRTGLAVVHAGEVVMPAKKSPLGDGSGFGGGVTVQITIHGNVIGIDDLKDEIVRVFNDEVAPTLVSRRY